GRQRRGGRQVEPHEYAVHFAERTARLARDQVIERLGEPQRDERDQERRAQPAEGEYRAPAELADQPRGDDPAENRAERVPERDEAEPEVAVLDVAVLEDEGAGAARHRADAEARDEAQSDQELD